MKFIVIARQPYGSRLARNSAQSGMMKQSHKPWIFTHQANLKQRAFTFCNWDYFGASLLVMTSKGLL